MTSVQVATLATPAFASTLGSLSQAFAFIEVALQQQQQQNKAVEHRVSEQLIKAQQQIESQFTQINQLNEQLQKQTSITEAEKQESQQLYNDLSFRLMSVESTIHAAVEPASLMSANAGTSVGSSLNSTISHSASTTANEKQNAEFMIRLAALERCTMSSVDDQRRALYESQLQDALQTQQLQIQQEQYALQQLKDRMRKDQQLLQQQQQLKAATSVNGATISTTVSGAVATKSTKKDTTELKQQQQQQSQPPPPRASTVLDALQLRPVYERIEQHESVLAQLLQAQQRTALEVSQFNTKFDQFQLKQFKPMNDNVNDLTGQLAAVSRTHSTTVTTLQLAQQQQNENFAAMQQQLTTHLNSLSASVSSKADARLMLDKVGRAEFVSELSHLRSMHDALVSGSAMQSRDVAARVQHALQQSLDGRESQQMSQLQNLLQQQLQAADQNGGGRIATKDELLKLSDELQQLTSRGMKSLLLGANNDTDDANNNNASASNDAKELRQYIASIVSDTNRASTVEQANERAELRRRIAQLSKRLQAAEGDGGAAGGPASALSIDCTACVQKRSYSHRANSPLGTDRSSAVAAMTGAAQCLSCNARLNNANRTYLNAPNASSDPNAITPRNFQEERETTPSRGGGFVFLSPSRPRTSQGESTLSNFASTPTAAALAAASQQQPNHLINPSITSPTMPSGMSQDKITTMLSIRPRTVASQQHRLGSRESSDNLSGNNNATNRHADILVIDSSVTTSTTTTATTQPSSARDTSTVGSDGRVYSQHQGTRAYRVVLPSEEKQQQQSVVVESARLQEARKLAKPFIPSNQG